MSLYLCIFTEQDEVAGLEVGAYGDYNALRRAVAEELEGGVAGSRFPTFMLHSDSDGEWSVDACLKLQGELFEIAAAMRELPTRPFPSQGQREAAEARGIKAGNAFECFVDVDGAFLIERLQGLVAVALEQGRPILFQ